MLPKLNKVKGIHPGQLLKWELNNQRMKSADLAQRIGEHKQTISAIINQRRSINPNLSIKLAEVFKTEKDYFMLLQASFDVKSAEEKYAKPTPNISIFRKVVFWDTDIQKLDWNTNKKAIIKRVLERGNATEIKEMLSFYGAAEVKKLVKELGQSRITAFQKNIEEFSLA